MALTIFPARTVAETIDFLNEALLIDRDALSTLLYARVPCSARLAEHPSIQIGPAEREWKDGVQGSRPSFVLGVLGLLNGLFGVDERGYGPITARVGDDGKIIAFERTKEA